MVIVVNANGTIIKSMQDSIYQGSNNANNIVLLAPFSASSKVTISFELPNGILTEELMMTMYKDIPAEYSGFSGWFLELNEKLTELYGTLKFQFNVYTNAYTLPQKEVYIVEGSQTFSQGWLSETEGGTALTPEFNVVYIVKSLGIYKGLQYLWNGANYGQTDNRVKPKTFGCSLEVLKGVRPILPATPNPNIYETILQALSSLDGDIININNNIGNLSDLETENKDNLVSAINEVKEEVDVNKEDLENAIQDIDNKKVDKRFEGPDDGFYRKINTIHNDGNGISLVVTRKNNVGTLQIRNEDTILSSGTKILQITPTSANINGKEILTDDLVDDKIVIHNQDADAHPAIREEIESINELIPNQASQTNQLADKNFVTDVVQTNTSNFRGSWEDFANVPEDAEYYPEDYAGNKKPTENDYIAIADASDYHSEEIFTKEGETEGYYISATGQIVANTDFAYSDELELDDKDKAVTLRATGISGRIFRVHAYDEEHNWIQEAVSGQSSGELVLYGTLPEGTKYLRVSYPKVADDIELYTHLTLGSWRFKYTGNWDEHGKAGWIPEYPLNDTPFTAAQLATINSGLVAEDKETINNSLQKDNIKTVGGQSIIGSGDIPTGSEPDGVSITENTDGEIQAVALKGKSITVTDNDIVYGDYDGSVDFESQADYESFVQNGSITKNGKTIYYSETGRYTTPEIAGEGGLVIETETTATVKGYQVPVLTAEQVTSIYNAVAAAKSVTVTDPSGNYHFGIDQADNMSGVISVEYKFFNTMYVTYELDDDTVTITGSLIGGGSQLYRHTIRLTNNDLTIYLSLILSSNNVLTTSTLNTTLKSGENYIANGYDKTNKKIYIALRERQSIGGNYFRGVSYNLDGTSTDLTLDNITMTSISDTVSEI